MPDNIRTKTVLPCLSERYPDENCRGFFSCLRTIDIRDKFYTIRRCHDCIAIYLHAVFALADTLLRQHERADNTLATGKQQSDNYYWPKLSNRHEHVLLACA